MNEWIFHLVACHPQMSIEHYCVQGTARTANDPCHHGVRMKNNSKKSSTSIYKVPSYR